MAAVAQGPTVGQSRIKAWIYANWLQSQFFQWCRIEPKCNVSLILSILYNQLWIGAKCWPVSSQSNSDLLILIINSICRRFIIPSFPWAFNTLFTYERTLSTYKYPLRWSEDWGKVPSDKHRWKLDLNKKTMEKICVRCNFKQFASQLKFSNCLWCGTRFFFF